MAPPNQKEPGTHTRPQLRIPSTITIDSSPPGNALAPRVASESPPDASGRLVIESVWPEIDGGRTAIKRVIHDWLEVSADIFSDGHGIVAAELLYRASDSTCWSRVPMHKGDNDRWSGRFELDRLLSYLYTIEAWLDPYASWADETRKKIAAERDVTIETIEGLQLRESVRQTCDDERLREFAARLEALEKGSRAQAELMLEDRTLALISLFAPRLGLSRYPLELDVRVDRAAPRFSSWYELFRDRNLAIPAAMGPLKMSWIACRMCAILVSTFFILRLSILCQDESQRTQQCAHC
jgi:starch synthase (maltosyl-transferring)